MNTLVTKIYLFESNNSNCAAKKMKLPLEETQCPHNNKIMKTSAIKKCLFGVPDPQDTMQMLQEQYEVDRVRIKSRFGFDVLDIENMERHANELEQVKKSKVLGARRKISGSRKRNVFKPYNNQAVLTDFFPSRKSAMQNLEKAKETKEN